MQLLNETDATRTWISQGSEAQAISDALSAMNMAIAAIGAQAEEAVKPIYEAQKMAVHSLLARHADELEALGQSHKAEIAASHAQFSALTSEESLKFHNWLWSSNPVMSRTNLPMININQFTEGSGIITILEKK